MTGKPEMRTYMRTMRQLLYHKPKEYALFVLGLHKGLDSRELMAITAGQVRGLEPGQELVLATGRRGRPKRIRLDETEIEAIRNLLESRAFGDQEPLFKEAAGNRPGGATPRLGLGGREGERTES